MRSKIRVFCLSFVCRLSSSMKYLANRLRFPAKKHIPPLDKTENLGLIQFKQDVHRPFEQRGRHDRQRLHHHRQPREGERQLRGAVGLWRHGVPFLSRGLLDVVGVHTVVPPSPLCHEIQGRWDRETCLDESPSSALSDLSLCPTRGGKL